MAPSFLLESVVGGDRIGRYSYLGSQPAAEIIARGAEVRYIDHLNPKRSDNYQSDDPLADVQRLTDQWRFVPVDGLPDFTGGWVGCVGYDCVRYLEGEKLSSPPPDDRHLPDIHMGLYRDVVAFDHVQKAILVITHVFVDEHQSVEAAYEAGKQKLDEVVNRIATPREVRGGGASGMGLLWRCLWGRSI